MISMLLCTAHRNNDVIIALYILVNLGPGSFQQEDTHILSYEGLIRWGRNRAICGKTVKITVVSSMRKKNGRA